MSYFLSYSPTNLMKGGNTINCEVNNKNRNKKSLNYIYIYTPNIVQADAD